MKISIKNFKSIGSVIGYEIKPLTVLSGNNSAGKSSFIQLLLLLKQTINLASSRYSLFIEGSFFSAKDYIDIFKDKNKDNKLEIVFEITKQEFGGYDNKIVKSIFDNLSDYTCHLTIVYALIENDVFIENFSLNYIISERENYIKFYQNPIDREIKIESNNEYFTKGLYTDIAPKLLSITYNSIFPVSYTLLRNELVDNPKGGEPLPNEVRTNEYPNIASVKSYLEFFFQELYYLGPLRTEPKDFYSNSNNSTTVGIKGENVAKILENRQKNPIHVFLPTFNNDLIQFTETSTTLLDATNYWICRVFKLGKRLYAKESGETYSIIFINENDVEATIKHVGFGVSQVLPIIVQGLLLNKGATFVLEQPEIHLHPKIQSLLFDFLHSLVLKGINIIVETHSDHFITRMRRRIAEDENNTLKELINLTFVEQSVNNLIFKTLDFDDYGTLTYFPNDFIERPDIELKALLKAQMKKRINTNQ